MRLGWIVVVAGLLAPQLVLARGSADKLAKAKGLYEDGEYAKASAVLEEMFHSSDLTAEELRQAHIYLAASYFSLGKEAQARKEFDALFRQSPLARVDPILFPPEIVEVANEEAKKLEAEADQSANKPPPPAPTVGTPQPSSPPKQPPTSTVVVAQPPQAQLENRTSVPSNTSAAAQIPRQTPPSVGYSFIPFGVGQFANEQYAKGAMFLTFEVLALATFTTAAALAESLKTGGTPFISYQVSPSDQDAFNRYETIYIVAFWTGVGIYAIGVVDSLVSRPSQDDLDARHGLASLELGPGRTLQLVPTGVVLRF